jgi:hypothetical protein
VLTVHVADLAGLTPPAVDAVAVNLTVVAPAQRGYATVYPCGARPLASTLNFVAGQTVANAAVVPVDRASGSICVYTSTAADVIVDLSGWLTAGGGFHPASPVRVFDTRPGTTGLRSVATTRIAAGSSLAVQFTDLPSRVPAQHVAAVVMNLTVVAADRPGYVTAYPCGQRPGTSSVNFAAGQVVANMVIVPVDAATGRVCFYASATVHLLADISGWYESGRSFTTTTPTRWVDTRPGTRAGALLQLHSRDLARLGLRGAVVAVSVNVTVTSPQGAGFVTVYACGARPIVSNVNYGRGQTVANTVIAAVDASGDVCIYSSAPTHLVVDVNGWFLAPTG